MNRWLARTAAACTGLSAFLTLHNAAEDRLYYAAAWLIAAIFAASWWVAQRRLIAAQERLESAEAWLADVHAGVGGLSFGLPDRQGGGDRG